MSRPHPDRYYVPLDQHIDIDRLRAMEAALTRKLETIRTSGEKSLFIAGERLDPRAPVRAGTRTVYLQRQTSGGYYQIHDASCWERSEWAEEFPELMDFIETLPFESYGRAFIIFDFDGIEEPVHRDHGDPDLHQEFIWLRPNMTKRFYIYDKAERRKHYVDSHSCWFDTRHYHGVDPSDGLAISIRVDGVFTEAMRAVIRQQQDLVPPRDLTVVEKAKKRLYTLGRNMVKPALKPV